MPTAPLGPTLNALPPGRMTLGPASCEIRYFGTLTRKARIRLVQALLVPGNMRGQGHATALMAEICALADADHLGLVVCPDAFSPEGEPAGPDDLTLRAWYARRFGFFLMQMSPVVLMLRTSGSREAG